MRAVWLTVLWAILGVAIFLAGFFAPSSIDRYMAFGLGGLIAYVAMIRAGVRYTSFRHFRGSFGIEPPKDYRDGDAIAHWVLKGIKDKNAKLGSVQAAVDSLIAEEPTTLEGLERKREQLGELRKFLQQAEREMDQARSAARFFSFRVPGTAEEIQKLSRLECSPLAPFES